MNDHRTQLDSPITLKMPNYQHIISTNIGLLSSRQSIRIQCVLIKKNLNKIRSQKWMAFIIIQLFKENWASSYLITWTSSILSEDGRQPCKRGNVTTNPCSLTNTSCIINSRIQTNASFEILLLGRHPPWLAKRMARASSSPLILVILVITKISP